jgi:hypothetical protein
MNRVAHQQLVTVLKDENGASRGPAQVKDGKITLDLSQTIETVKVELAKKGLGFLENVSVPPVKRTIVLIDAGGIDRARTASKLLNMVAWLLPIVAIGCFVCSAVMVRPRRRATVRAGIVAFAGAAFTLALLAVGRYFYLDAATPPGGNGKAAAAVWDILLRNLRIGVIAVGLAGLLVAFVAWLSGSTGGAEHLRAIASRGIGALRVKADEAGYVPGPVAEFVAEYKRGLQFAATLLAVVILVLEEPDDRRGRGHRGAAAARPGRSRSSPVARRHRPRAATPTRVRRQRGWRRDVLRPAGRRCGDASSDARARRRLHRRRGLAGLACARALSFRGVTCTVLEASDGVGGRVRTDVVDGFRLDRGFQIALTAYPELHHQLDVRRLSLQRFEPGALVRVNGRLRHVADPHPPRHAVATHRAVRYATDKARLLRTGRRRAPRSLAPLLRRPPDGAADPTTLEEPVDRGPTG